MKKVFIAIFLHLFITVSGFAQNTDSINRCGNYLKQFLLSQNVESLWLAGSHIDWFTGIPDDPNATKGIESHCSAFVASVCAQSGIYILRPPDHSSQLLASAQYGWLSSKDGFDKGWRQIKDSIYIHAQNFANKGYFVVAVYKNLVPKKPGHIALVMPDVKSFDDINSNGPTMIQAGTKNHNYIALRAGFKRHIEDWNTATEIIYFYYNIKKIDCR